MPTYLCLIVFAVWRGRNSSESTLRSRNELSQYSLLSPNPLFAIGLRHVTVKCCTCNCNSESVCQQTQCTWIFHFNCNTHSKLWALSELTKLTHDLMYDACVFHGAVLRIFRATLPSYASWWKHEKLDSAHEIPPLKKSCCLSGRCRWGTQLGWRASDRTHRKDGVVEDYISADARMG